MTDGRRSAAHVARNAEPIADQLRFILPARGLGLELWRGKREHREH